MKRDATDQWRSLSQFLNYMRVCAQKGGRAEHLDGLLIEGDRTSLYRLSLAALDALPETVSRFPTAWAEFVMALHEVTMSHWN